MRHWPIIAVIILAAVSFRPAMERTLAEGHDFPIYYAVAHGEHLQGEGVSGWVYNDKTAVVFSPFKAVSYEVAYGIMYAISLASLFLVWRRMRHLRRRYPAVGWLATVAFGFMGAIVIRLGNIDLVLALAVTTPLGAVLAGCIKPYLLLFVLLHAAIHCHKRSVGVRALLQAAAPTGGPGGSRWGRGIHPAKLTALTLGPCILITAALFGAVFWR